MELLALRIKGRREMNGNERNPQSQNLIVETRRVLAELNGRRLAVVRLERERLHLLVPRTTNGVQLDRRNLQRPKCEARIIVRDSNICETDR